MNRVDITTALDERPMSPLQIRAVLLTCALSALDGYDVLAMTFAAPGLTRAWDVGRAALGLAFSAGLVGMAAGSLLVAPLGDRLGRRPIVIAMLLLMTMGMTLCAFSNSVVELAMWRIMTGVGIGAMVPLITPLAAEFSNARRRTLMVGVMSIGYPIGGTIGGFAASMLLRHYDWPAVFVLGVVAALLLLPAVVIWLPEPPAFLMTRRDGRSLSRLNRFLERCGMASLEALPPQEDRTARSSYKSIFAAGQVAATLIVTAVNACFILTVYFILSWMPQMVADAGFSPAMATAVATCAAASGVVASILRGAVAERLPARWLTPALLVGTGLTTCLFGVAPPVPAALFAMAALLGAFLYSSVVGLYAVMVAAFPPAMRTTGTGFVMGLGRIAGAAAPAIAGAMFATGMSPIAVTAILSTGATAAGLALFVVLRRPTTEANPQAYTSRRREKFPRRRQHELCRRQLRPAAQPNE